MFGVSTLLLFALKTCNLTTVSKYSYWVPSTGLPVCVIQKLTSYYTKVRTTFLQENRK